MDARDLEATERVSASRKLGKDDARALLRGSKRLLVAKGKKVSEWSIGRTPDDEAVAAMLGPTGNLRAPTIRVGSTIVVGFNEAMWEQVFG